MVHCHVCGNEDITYINNLNLKSSVSSDCKVGNNPVNIIICNNCGCVQKLITNDWNNINTEIYDSYSNYYQGSGTEQSIYIDGKPIHRSQRILDGLINIHQFPENGKLLDIGCGNGPFLNVFHSAFPKWELEGSELNDHNKDIIEKIPNFKKLWVCSPNSISGEYNLITMIHLLEHIINPIDFLKDTKKLLSGGGEEFF